MKKTIWTIGIISLMCCLGLCGCGSTGLIYENADRYSVGATEITDTVENIDLEWIEGSVKIEYHDENTVKLAETSSATLSEETQVHWYLDGTTLRIKFSAPTRYRFRHLNKKLTLTLPQGFSAGNIDISLASATLDAEELTAEKIEISTALGNVSLIAAATEKINISSASGEISLTQRGICDTVSIDSASGDITVTSEYISGLNVHSASGKVYLYAESLLKSDIDTASGSVNLNISGTLDECDIKTASGDVTLSLPESLGFTADIDTSSGNFESDFAMTKNGNKYICGNGKADIDIDTASGNISFKSILRNQDGV